MSEYSDAERLLKNMSLSQKSRAGKASEVNFNLSNQTISAGRVFKFVELQNATEHHGDSGILLNATLIRVVDGAHSTADLDWKLKALFFEEELDLDTDDALYWDGMPTKVPFAILDFDTEDNDFNELTSEPDDGYIQFVKASTFLPATFKTESDSKSIYCCLFNATGSDGIVINGLGGESWTVQASISY